MIYLNKKKVISTSEWWEIIDSLNLRNKLEKARTIIIKPNLAAGSYIEPYKHVISDLELLKSIIEFIYKANPSSVIYIAESDSTGYGFAFLKFEHIKLPDCLNLPTEIKKNVMLLDMTRDRLTKVEDSRFVFYKTIDHQLWLSDTLIKSDFIVSLSNLKTHAVTGYTGACKNLFGCLPDFDKSIYHPVINKVIHDLVLGINPDLNVVDAFYGMEGNGPVQGIDIDTGYRVFSNDALEADVLAASSIGYAPQKIGYLKKLSKTKHIQLKNNLNSIITPFRKPGKFLRFMNSIGLIIQKFGNHIANFGHRIHSCPSFLVLVITIARPLLLEVFDYEALKRWKRKIIK